MCIPHIICKLILQQQQYLFTFLVHAMLGVTPVANLQSFLPWKSMTENPWIFNSSKSKLIFSSPFTLLTGFCTVSERWFWCIDIYNPVAAAAARQEVVPHDQQPLEENINRMQAEGEEARGVEEAIAVLRFAAFHFHDYFFFFFCFGHNWNNQRLN